MSFTVKRLQRRSCVHDSCTASEERARTIGKIENDDLLEVLALMSGRQENAIEMIVSGLVEQDRMSVQMGIEKFIGYHPEGSSCSVDLGVEGPGWSDE